jgi:plastocyanin
MNSTSRPFCYQPFYFVALVSCFMLLMSGFPSSSLIEVVHSAGHNFYKTTGNEGSLRGKVTFKGVIPARKSIDMSQDGNCHSINPKAKAQDVQVSREMLANVLVYVKAGEALNLLAFEPPNKPVVIDQQLCQFVPRVVGVQTGQPVQYLNSDPTTHNIHPAPRNNVEWNQVQGLGGEPIEKSFKRPELFIKVKCNQHPWMLAYVNVFAHPFFAVTGKDGAFEIAGLPPGKYTIAAWHEVFGEQTIEVTINPQEAKNLSFTFNAKVAYAPTSLKEERAIILQ